jgi:hypothetical protein
MGLLAGMTVATATDGIEGILFGGKIRVLVRVDGITELVTFRVRIGVEMTETWIVAVVTADRHRLALSVGVDVTVTIPIVLAGGTGDEITVGGIVKVVADTAVGAGDIASTECWRLGQCDQVGVIVAVVISMAALGGAGNVKTTGNGGGVAVFPFEGHGGPGICVEQRSGGTLQGYVPRIVAVVHA